MTAAKRWTAHSRAKTRSTDPAAAKAAALRRTDRWAAESRTSQIRAGLPPDTSKRARRETKTVGAVRHMRPQNGTMAIKPTRHREPTRADAIFDASGMLNSSAMIEAPAMSEGIKRALQQMPVPPRAVKTASRNIMFGRRMNPMNDTCASLRASREGEADHKSEENEKRAEFHDAACLRAAPLMPSKS